MATRDGTRGQRAIYRRNEAKRNGAYGSVQRHRRNEAKRSGVPLAVDEVDTQKSGTLFADELRAAHELTLRS